MPFLYSILNVGPQQFLTSCAANSHHGLEADFSGNIATQIALESFHLRWVMHDMQTRVGIDTAARVTSSPAYSQISNNRTYFYHFLSWTQLFVVEFPSMMNGF